MTVLTRQRRKLHQESIVIFIFCSQPFPDAEFSFLIFGKTENLYDTFLHCFFFGFKLYRVNVCQVFPFSESYGIPANVENVKLPGELRKLLLSSPFVLRELRQVALQDDSDGYESEKKSSRWKRSSETDQQLAFAVAFSVFKDFQSQDSLKNKGKI